MTNEAGRNRQGAEKILKNFSALAAGRKSGPQVPCRPKGVKSRLVWHSRVSGFSCSRRLLRAASRSTRSTVFGMTVVVSGMTFLLFPFSGGKRFGAKLMVPAK
jgi:hypothetical protein